MKQIRIIKLSLSDDLLNTLCLCCELCSNRVQREGVSAGAEGAVDPSRQVRDSAFFDKPLKELGLLVDVVHVLLLY